jgi:hypothetical protein
MSLNCSSGSAAAAYLLCNNFLQKMAPEPDFFLMQDWEKTSFICSA